MEGGGKEVHLCQPAVGRRRADGRFDERLRLERKVGVGYLQEAVFLAL